MEEKFCKRFYFFKSPLTSDSFDKKYLVLIYCQLFCIIKKCMPFKVPIKYMICFLCCFFLWDSFKLLCCLSGSFRTFVGVFWDPVTPLDSPIVFLLLSVISITLDKL